jgi:hypothetical protein
VTFPTDRHKHSTLLFRMGDCIFPRPGLYWVEFHCDGIEILRQPLILR